MIRHESTRRTEPGRRRTTPRAGARRPHRALAIAIVWLSACGGDGETIVEPTFDLEALHGDYVLDVLTFDPRGSLPVVDIRARFQLTEAPELVVTEAQLVQLLFREGTGLRQTVAGSWQLLETGIRVTFADGAAAGRLLVPQVVDLTFAEPSASLTFNGEVTGVSRASLVALVPEWENEQLLDPTPGDLVIRFVKTAPVTQ